MYYNNNNQNKRPNDEDPNYNISRKKNRPSQFVITQEDLENISHSLHNVSQILDKVKRSNDSMRPDPPIPFDGIIPDRPIETYYDTTGRAYGRGINYENAVYANGIKFPTKLEPLDSRQQHDKYGKYDKYGKRSSRSVVEPGPFK